MDRTIEFKEKYLVAAIMELLLSAVSFVWFVWPLFLFDKEMVEPFNYPFYVFKEVSIDFNALANFNFNEYLKIFNAYLPFLTYFVPFVGIYKIISVF